MRKVWNAIKTACPHATLNRESFCPFWKECAECKKVHKIERWWAHCTESLFSSSLAASVEGSSESLPTSQSSSKEGCISATLRKAHILITQHKQEK